MSENQDQQWKLRGTYTTANKSRESAWRQVRRPDDAHECWLKAIAIIWHMLL